MSGVAAYSYVPKGFILMYANTNKEKCLLNLQ